MSDPRIDRRTFLKLMGVTGSGVFLTLSGCDRGVSLEDGKETVTSYVDPEEFVVPGDEVWYASTCAQCPAGCGLHARVREGRVRKLEGNPDSPVSRGRLCAMGQAGLQRHYHPDRLRQPLARSDGRLRPINWDAAHERLARYLARVKRAQGEGFALLTGAVDGHLAAVVQAFMAPLARGRHSVYEPLNDAIARQACRQVLGTDSPRLHLERARLIVSVGADFLGPWRSPVQFAAGYAEFRSAPRGSLIQIEPEMSLTGANADWWLPLRPGTEGWLMLGVARLLAAEPRFAKHLPADVVESLARYEPAKVSAVTDVPVESIERLARALRQRQPSLVLVGGPAESHTQGAHHVAAGLLLNRMLGNIGTTLVADAAAAYPGFSGRPGSSAELRALRDALASVDTLFIAGANPVYSAPEALGFDDALGRVADKVVFTDLLDETAMAADLVIPVRSPLEDWGSRLPPHSPQPGLLHLQQPVMRPLYPHVPGLGDLFVQWAGQLDAGFGPWDDFYAYLRDNLTRLRPMIEASGARVYALPPLLQPPVLQPPSPEQALPPGERDRLFWEAAVARGLLPLPAPEAAATVARDPLPIVLSAPADDPDYPFHLLPSPRLGLYDGRHADLPWAQEVPDPLTTVVWDSWAEIHPQTAQRLSVREGDELEIRSAHGSLRVKAVLFPGIHPEAIAVPLGQGHRVGRYASDVGVNPFKILSPVIEPASGELALYATRVQVRKTGRREAVVKLAASDSQHKRRLVRTLPAGSARPLRETPS